MAAPKKGTATPLGAVFSPEETKRAVARVSESIADRRAELGRLQGFVADNAALVSLVNRLPDELSHDIMVFPSLQNSETVDVMSSFGDRFGSLPASIYFDEMSLWTSLETKQLLIYPLQSSTASHCAKFVAIHSE